MTQSEIDRLLAPLVSPSGIWADYNPLLRYYYQLQRLERAGVLPPGSLPAKPSIDDFTDLTSPRSDYWSSIPDPKWTIDE